MYQIREYDVAVLLEDDAGEALAAMYGVATYAFASTSRANKRLLKLVRAGLLRRFFLGSGGGRKALYSLSERGALAADAPFRGLRRKQGAVLAMDFFVEHQPAVNAVFLAARYEKNPVLRKNCVLPEKKRVAAGHMTAVD